MTGGDWAAWAGVLVLVIGWALMVERRLAKLAQLQAQALQRVPHLETALTEHVADRRLHPNGKLASAYQQVVTERIDGLESTVNARIEGVAGHVRGVDGRLAQLSTEVHGLSGSIMDVLRMLGNRRGEGA